MSIFEPLPRDSRWDEGTHEIDDVPPDDESAPGGGSLDPRSITIAGLTVLAIVIAGLIVSNASEPDVRPDRLVPARVDPGAAAVEQAEAKRVAPTAEPVDEVSGDADPDRAPDESVDDSWRAGDGKWDKKPGRGNGRGR